MSGSRPSGRVGARGGIRRRGLLPPGTAFTLGIATLLGALEAAARACRTDAEDLVGLAALALVADLVRRRHRRDPLSWVAAAAGLARAAAAAVKRETVEVGIDLRGSPPLPRGFPPILGGLVGTLAVAAVAVALFPGLEPVAVRAAIRSVSALAWLALLGASWALFLAGCFHLFFLAFALTHDELVRAHRGPTPRSRFGEFAALLAWLGGVLAGWTLLPGWAAAAVHGACLAAAALALAAPGGPDVALLWRRRGGAPGGSSGSRGEADPGVGSVRSASWRAHTLAGTSALGLLLASTALFVHGPALRGGGSAAVEEVLPLTSSLSSLFAWTGAAALAAWTLLVLRMSLGARFRDPARAAAPEAWVADRPAAAERDLLLSALGARGVEVGFAPAAPSRTAVPIVVGDGPVPEGALRIDPMEAGGAESMRRLVRRHELRCRRLLLRGLEGLFRRAAARRFERGSGFWVAPWHWFCIGLSRDEDERALEWREGTFFLGTVGPAYGRVFPRPVLAHVHRVMRDLQVDLVFVEDGVGWRRLRRVLRMAFELHDMFGANGRAEECHFTGLPGVRVLFHDVALDAPRTGKLRGYPEPDYDTVGRARVLHVFRDRGEAEDPVDAPRDRRGVPVPA
jgi:hypothetical protein